MAAAGSSLPRALRIPDLRRLAHNPPGRRRHAHTLAYTQAPQLVQDFSFLPRALKNEARSHTRARAGTRVNARARALVAYARVLHV